MRKSILRTSVLIALTLAFFSYTTKKPNPNKEVSILFIGNSLTYYNDMPQILQKMFDEQKYNYKVSQSTYPGISLTQHFNRKIVRTEKDTKLSPLQPGDTSETEKVLFSKHWDFVVLQDGTVRLLIPEVKMLLVIPAIQSIQNKHKSDVSEFILFKTWPNLDTFPKQHCYPKEIIDKSVKKDMCCSPIMNSFNDEAALINSAYDTVALATSLKSVPVTNCFMDIMKNYPNINLFQDKSHPSKLGAYLNACIFFKRFTKLSASKIKYTADIDKTIAQTIQKVVDKNYP